MESSHTCLLHSGASHAHMLVKRLSLLSHRPIPSIQPPHSLLTKTSRTSSTDAIPYHMRHWQAVKVESKEHTLEGNCPVGHHYKTSINHTQRAALAKFRKQFSIYQKFQTKKHIYIGLVFAMSPHFKWPWIKVSPRSM